MGLPAPKLRSLKSWMLGESSKTLKDPIEIWEIGVPAKHSLYWSIMMSYLLLDSNLSDKILQKLVGDEKEMNEIKNKKSMEPGKFNLKEVQREVGNFNPFKNRHVPFFWPNLTGVFRIFKSRLNAYSYKIKSRFDEWNDELKLEGASKMLHCQIVVYFPDEGGCRISFGKNVSLKIILFQYKDQECGSNLEKFNIFHFGMEIHHVHLLKLNALGHVLNKTRISKEVIAQLKHLMNDPETHGKCFLPTLLQSEYVDVLPDLYISPYIVLKLSEAGFETDPTATLDGKPSPLCYALVNANRKYIQILCDYASNCRCLFDRCIRSDDCTILEYLKRLKDIFENDILKISCCKFEDDIEKKATDTLKQFSRFVEYQYEAVSTAKHLKTQLSNQTNFNKFQFWKSIIESILNCYLKYFYYGSLNSEDFFEKFTNYLDSNEFYGNIDSFASISFFDNFYSLKCCFGIKEENNFLHIEWLLFLAMMSNKYYPKYDHCVTCKDNHENRKCEKEKNILRFIPFLHRIATEEPLKKLLTELRNTQNPQTVPRSISSNTCTFPQIVDVLLMARLQKYITAALEDSTQMDSVKHVLAIERALQVIGESLKPPSIKSSVVSFLLCARLPRNLQREFIKIRNDLSKCRSNSVYGRLQVEKQDSFCNDMTKELKVIQKAFEIVDFTQDLRIEESVTSNCIEELKKYKLEPNIIQSFHEIYEYRINAKRNEYEMHHNECIQLLNDIITELHDNLTQDTLETNLKDESLGQLKATEYLLNFICKYNKDSIFQNSLEEVKNLSKQSDAGSVVMKSDLIPFLSHISEYLKREIINLKCWKTDLSISTPKILNFFELLKMNEFSSNEQIEIKDAVDEAYKESREAEDKLINIFEQNSFDSTNVKIECLLKQITFSEENTEKLRSCIQSRNTKQGLKYLKQSNLSDSLKESIQNMLESGSNVDGYGNMLLMKIAFPDSTGKNVYESVRLSPEVNRKLKNCLTKKAHFLLDRIRALKSILIDDDDEIKAAWKFGRSQAMKYHMKFLMRQRYIRENVIQASMEMAFFDCLNILNRKDLGNLYEKSAHLFAGIDLRNVISHRFCITETIGTILDEDDFSSEIIDKILELIEDSETIECLLTLYEKSGICSRKGFESYIRKALDDNSLDTKVSKTLKNCSKWESYLSVFPLMQK